MRQISVFIFLFFYVLGFTQSVSIYDPADHVAYPDQQYFCSGENFNLKIDAVATSTGDYAVTKDLPSNFPLGAGSTPIIFSPTGTNKFSESFPIGFNFSFYGKTYSRVVMGSNGRLVFTNDPQLENLKDVNQHIDRTFSGITGYNTYSALPSTDYNKVYRNNPTQELDLAQIFFGYTDLVPKSQNSSVTYLYKNVSVGGVNGLLVSFQNMIRTNGTGGISSVAYYSNILILQDSRIIIYVNNKTESSYNAILGIQNDNATKFKVPAHSNAAFNYNNGPWISEGVAWVFSPNQNLTPQIKWLQNGTVIGTADTLNNFAPNDNDVLKVEVSYFDGSGNQVGATVSDQINFKTIQKPVIQYTNAACVTGVSMSVTADPNLNYQWFKVGDATVLGTGNTYYATQNGNYFVRATRKIKPGSCFEDSAPVTVNLNSTIPPFNPSNTPTYFCETTGIGNRAINLYDYYPPNPSQYVLKFFNDTGIEVTDPANYTIFPNTTTEVTVDVNDPVSGCTLNHKFTMRFDSLPTSFHNLPAQYCFGDNSVDAANYLNLVAGLYISSFDYLYSTDGVNFSTNSVFDPVLYPRIWIRIFPKNPVNATCFTISSILFTEGSKVIANTPNPNNPDFQQCASATQYFDLTKLFPEINPSPNVTITFHTSLLDAQSGANPVSYQFRSGMGYTTLFIRVVDNNTGCASPDHPQIELLVYRKPNLLVSSIPLANCQGNSIFNLTQNPNSITDAQSPIVVKLEYYSPTGTLLTGTQITNYNEAVSGANPYLKVIYNPTCSDIVNFNLTYNPKPVSLVSQILICGETTYPLQSFKDNVINNSAQYTFTQQNGNPFPPNFNVSVLPLTVRFFITDNVTGCVSDLQTVTFVQGSATLLLATETVYPLCDDDFDGKTSFDLDSKKSIFTNDPNATFEYFKDVNLTQNITSPYTNETAFNQTVYVKITIPGFCPSIAKIYLKVNIPSESFTLLDKYFICYGETITIDAGTENTQWEWSTGETSQTIQITEAGNYSVKLTNSIGCSYTHSFVVSDENQPKIETINQTNNSIEVIANGGLQPYIYYFNGVAQTSNILYNPTAASYVIQVESANGCLGEPKTVYFIKINNAFTPNADGINDFWTIENLGKMQNIDVKIVDRFGKLVYDYSKNQTLSNTSPSPNPSSANDPVWDGKNNGRALPTSTYWYTATWFDAVTNKNEQRQGWIFLKNRN